MHFADGTHYVQGNRCERGEIIGDLNDHTVRLRVAQATRRIQSVPNLVEERERLVMAGRKVPSLCASRGITIGIPRALDSWTRLPFWRALFSSLGFKVRVSEKSSYELYESALSTIPSDTICFPAKLAHGHFQSLVDAGVDRIFTPIILQGLPRHPALDEDYPCAVLHGYGLVLKSNIPTSIPHDITSFIWKNPSMREKQLTRYFDDTFGIEADLVRQAIEIADHVNEAFEQSLRKRAEAVIRRVEDANGFAVVLSMRPYQNDPLVNHHIGKYFTRLGVPVIPADALPGITDTRLDDLEVCAHSNIQATLYSAAKIVARHPQLEFVHISSFGCGHEAVMTDELDRILRSRGKQILLLKLDESDVRGPLRIRITSFIDTVRQQRQAPLPVPRSARRKPPTFSRADARVKTIYLPNLSVGFARMMSAILTDRGFRIRVLPLADERAIELGKLHLHNDICFPAQINVGEFLRICLLYTSDAADDSVLV